MTVRNLPVIIFLLCCALPSGAATYYVSSSGGSDSNSGLSASSARKTIAGLSSAMKSGNTIYLKRGDIFFESISGFTACTIDAYGSGSKPVICGFMIMRDASYWTEESSGVWKVDLNNSAAFYGHACNASVYTYGNIGAMYDRSADVIYGNLVSKASLLKNEMDFFTSETYLKKSVTSSTYRYLRVRASSRPGALYFSSGESGIRNMNDCKLRNLAIVGFGQHGMEYLYNCTVQNCDIDIIGGCISVGSSDHWARIGNGIQHWMSSSPCNGNTVTLCQISRCYDTAATIQGNCPDGVQPAGNNFTRNRIAWCRQGFEHWLSASSGTPSFSNCSFNDNVLYCCGDNRFIGLSARSTDVALLCYRSPAAALPIQGNLIYGGNYRYTQEMVSGISGGEVYIVKGDSVPYILNIYSTGGSINYKITADDAVQAMLYLKYSADDSAINIVQSGSSADTAAKDKVLSALNYVSPVPSASEFEKYR